MPQLPLPDRCIWCLTPWSKVATDESHVLPECVGNEHQQVLPPGVVCKPCNVYFGSKVEPALLDYPLFHVTAAFLRVVDPSDGNAFRDQIFDATHPATGQVNRRLDVRPNIKSGNPTKIAVDITHTIHGRLEADLAPRQLALISRAIHKIAFESVAWSQFVGGNFNGEPMDFASAGFEAVRQWGRQGQPMRPIRPVFWRPPQRGLSHEWEVIVWRLPHEAIAAELRIWGDWYAVDFTAPTPQQAREDLRSRCNPTEGTLCSIAESIERVTWESPKLFPSWASPKTWFRRLLPGRDRDTRAGPRT